MADKMRWRYGDTNPVQALVRGDAVIEIGDLLWQDKNGFAWPMSDYCLKYSDENTTNCGRRFLGVAMQRSRAGDTDEIRVAISGVFEFDFAPRQQASEAYCLGDEVEPEYCDAIDAFEDQNVAVNTADSHESMLIGYLTRPIRDGATTMLVDIRSQIMHR